MLCNINKQKSHSAFAYVRFFVYLCTIKFNLNKILTINPLAELNQRIFDSSNGFIVNKVNIL